VRFFLRLGAIGALVGWIVRQASRSGPPDDLWQRANAEADARG
jgi:hypothetical protein